MSFNLLLLAAAAAVVFCAKKRAEFLSQKWSSPRFADGLTTREGRKHSVDSSLNSLFILLLLPLSIENKNRIREEQSDV